MLIRNTFCCGVKITENIFTFLQVNTAFTSLLAVVQSMHQPSFSLSASLVQASHVGDSCSPS